MPQTFTSLLLKEFHEQKWRVLSLTTIYIAVMLYGFNDGFVSPTTPFTFLMNSHIIFGSIYIAMSVVAGEYHSSTFNFTRALPTNPKTIITAKLTMAIISISIPIIVISAITLTWAIFWDPRFHLIREISILNYKASTQTQVYITCLIYLATGCLTTLWCIALTINRRTELGVSTNIFAIMIALAIIAIILGTFQLEYTLMWIVRITPYGFVYIYESVTHTSKPVTHFWPTVFIHLTLSPALIAWTLHRFSRDPISIAKDKTPLPNQSSKQPSRLPNPFASTFTSLLWQQWRIARPAVYAGSLIFIIMSFLYATSNSLIQQYNNTPRPEVAYQTNPQGRYIPTQEQKDRNHLKDSAYTRFAIASGFSTSPAILLAIIVAVGLFSSDILDKHLAFWRTRPINPATCLTIRYAIGALAISLPIYGPAYLNFLYSTAILNSPQIDHLNSLFFNALFIFPLIQLGAYTLTVFLILILRKPVFAGIIAFGIMLAIVIDPEIYNSHFDSLPEINFTTMFFLRYPFYLTCLFAIAAMLTATYLLIKRNAALDHWIK